jgi:hypothetical protein
VLAAGAAGPLHGDVQILRVDPEVDLLRFRQHRDGRRRGVDAPARLGDGDALNPVNA